MFRDVDNIPIGITFAMHLQQMLGKSGVVLVIIGPSWLTATDEQGRRRLDDPNDFVRVEVEAALRANVPVVPILFSNATMPLASELPKSIQKLVSRQGSKVRSDLDFDTDIKRLFIQINYVRRFKIKPKRDNDNGKDPAPRPARRTGFKLFVLLLLLSCIASASIVFLDVLDGQSIARVWLDRRIQKLTVKRAQPILDCTGRNAADVDTGRLDKWIVDATNLLSRDKTSGAAVPVLNNRGGAWARKGRLDKGLADFEAASKINPTDATAHHWQGLILARLGDPAKAKIAFDQAVKLDKSFDTHPKNQLDEVVPQPMPLDEWLQDRKGCITVAQYGPADCSKIQVALDKLKLKPGWYVKVLDKGPYRERLKATLPADVGLISEVGSVIELPEWDGTKDSVDPAKTWDWGSDLTCARGVRLAGFEFIGPRAPTSTKGTFRVVIRGQGDVVVESCRILMNPRYPFAMPAHDHKDYPWAIHTSFRIEHWNGPCRLFVMNNYLDRKSVV